MESIEYLGRQLPLLGHYDTVVVAAVLPVPQPASAAPSTGRRSCWWKRGRFWAARLPVRWCAP